MRTHSQCKVKTPGPQRTSSGLPLPNGYGTCWHFFGHFFTAHISHSLVGFDFFENVYAQKEWFPLKHVKFTTPISHSLVEFDFFENVYAQKECFP